MRNIFWTEQSRSDLAAIHAFIAQDSPHYASVVVRQLIAATEQLGAFPESGRTVPEFDNPEVRDIVRRPYPNRLPLGGRESDPHLDASSRGETLSTDPRAGIVRRHHLSESVVQKAVKVAAANAKISKPVSVYTLRSVSA